MASDHPAPVLDAAIAPDGRRHQVTAISHQVYEQRHQARLPRRKRGDLAAEQLAPDILQNVGPKPALTRASTAARPEPGGTHSREKGGDKRIIRLVQKWLKAGVLEDGVVSVSAKGTGQGAVISPLLANIYLHYVLDLWAECWRRREATGDMIIVRYVDDFIVGFQHEADARRLRDDMRKRFEEFSLSLNPDKTRLIEFGRFAAERRAQRGLGKPETFNVLGFTFICERNSRGKFLVMRITRRDRMRATLKEVKEELRRRMHEPIPKQGAWLTAGRQGLLRLPRRPTNGAALKAFHTTSSASGCARCGGAVRSIASRGTECTAWPPTGIPDRKSFIRILTSVSPSHTQGGSRVRESRSHGSGRGAVSNDRPYRTSLRTFRTLTPKRSLTFADLKVSERGEADVRSERAPDIYVDLL